jgi:hypothetical protein
LSLLQLLLLVLLVLLLLLLLLAFYYRSSRHWPGDRGDNTPAHMRYLEANFQRSPCWA